MALETRKVLLGHRNGDVTSHYSAPEIEELLVAVKRVCEANPVIDDSETQNGLEGAISKPLILCRNIVVAGVGFEPTTFGL